MVLKNEDFVSVSDIAKHLSISTTKVYELADQGYFGKPVFIPQKGGKKLYRLMRCAVQAFIDQGGATGGGDDVLPMVK